jgi:hypothetical protein
VTLTLAELYARQGLHGRAREIYRTLAEGGDEVARQRLSELPPPSPAIGLLEELLKRVRTRRKAPSGKGP